MSGYLWKSYLEDDVESFRHVLENATYTARLGAAHKSHGHGQVMGFGSDSPSGYATSPTLTTKSRKIQEAQLAVNAAGPLVLTRQDINHRDNQGRTLLHLIASSSAESAYEFAAALLEHPLTDVYLQDSENGWTALHRAFYVGNLSIAHAILARDSQDAMGHGTGNLHRDAGGLIKIKDSEGNGPFDLFEMTFLDKDGSVSMARLAEQATDIDEDAMSDGGEYANLAKSTGFFDTLAATLGDEVSTFGSNKNVTLGFGDEDDRQFPERINLKRPDHLYFRFYREHLRSEAMTQGNEAANSEEIKAKIRLAKSMDDLPAVIRNRPITIQNVHMAKFSSAILTTDPESNLYTCGHGSGGRLGTGDERTRFQFVCIDGGALAKKKVISVVLGQNHTIALSDGGEVFSWGNNGYGQLGLGLPKVVPKEDPISTTPKQIFGPLKREMVTGIAASRLHSVAHTATSLFTWGKNEGQLGLVDSDARSLEVQDTPRKVAASLFSTSIASVSAIDRATIVLLENHEVWVFANYGYAKVPFPLDSFTNYFLQKSFRATKYETTPNTICKVVGSGDTICAMSTSGDVFTVSVGQPAAATVGLGSTTNPSKIKAALSQATRIWSNKKSHMAARDVDVDQNGSIILVTDAGSVWRRVTRAKIKDATAAGAAGHKPKDYKFTRISGLTRVVAVRASGSGAYAAVRQDCTKTREDIEVRPMSLGADLIRLSPFEFAGSGIPEVRSAMFGADRLLLDQKLGASLQDGSSIESMIQALILAQPRTGQPYDLRLSSASSEVQIPIHSFLLGARSKAIRHGFEAFVASGSYAVPDIFSITRGNDHLLEITFENIDLLTVFYLVLYLYTEEAVRYGQMPIFPIPTNNSVAIHRQAQRDLVKLAARLDMSHLASAIERSLNNRTLHRDMDEAIKDPECFANADVIVQLADDEVPVHGALVCQRSPFFSGLFKGRAGGAWLAERRQGLANPSDAIRIDLSHVESSIFAYIMRYLYADTGPELFDDYVAKSLDDFLDHVIEVMGVANELMLDRLCEVCQFVLGQYVTVRNVCQLVNAVAPCSVDVFKRRALEYICINLEACLQHGLLDDLEESLFFELDEVARGMQMSCSLMARSGALEEGLLERHPELSKRIELERQSKIDSIVVFNKYADADNRASTSFVASSFHEMSLSETPGSQPKTRRRASKDASLAAPSPLTSPTLKSQRSINDLMFDMDHEEDDSEFEPATPSKSPMTRPMSSAHSTIDDGSQRRPSNKSALMSREPSMLDLGSPLAERSLDLQGPSPRVPGRPWGASPMSSEKLDLKTILEQTPSRTSNLSSALSSNSQPPIKGPGFSTVKVSQKERKRQQAQAVAVSPVASPSTSMSNKPGNPWQTMSSKSKPVSPAIQPMGTSLVAPTPPKTPQLTMRQTVAKLGTSAPKDRKTAGSPASSTTTASTSIPAPSSSLPQRPLPSTSRTPSKHTPKSPDLTTTTASTSSKITTQTLPPSPSGPGFSINPTPPPVQSVRHAPLPQKPSALSGLFSMAEILAYEQAEKDGIREAATSKRSLAEIQAEQEFLDWWEEEARRVRVEEEETRRLIGESLGRGGGGVGAGVGARGGRSRRGKGKSEGKKADAPGRIASQSAPSDGTGQNPIPSRRGGNHSHGRGRGGSSHKADGSSGPRRQSGAADEVLVPASVPVPAVAVAGSAERHPRHRGPRSRPKVSSSLGHE